MGQSRATRERVAKTKLECLAALQKYPDGAIATQIARDTGLNPASVGGVMRYLAEEGAICRRFIYHQDHGNIVALWIPDPRAGCEKPQARPRRTPVPPEDRRERQSFIDKALAKEHAEWVGTLKKPRFNPWGKTA